MVNCIKMKKGFLILLLSMAFMSCKKERQSQENQSLDSTIEAVNDGLTTMRGDFIYHSDAAVLQTQNNIYAVVIDDNMHKLNARVKPYKKENTDMIPVTVRVKKFPKPEGEEGWPFRVEIKEIIDVHQPTDTNDVIRIGEK